jgi:hypothetical protein
MVKLLDIFPVLAFAMIIVLLPLLSRPAPERRDRSDDERANESGREPTSEGRESP